MTGAVARESPGRDLGDVRESIIVGIIIFYCPKVPACTSQISGIGIERIGVVPWMADGTVVVQRRRIGVIGQRISIVKVSLQGGACVNNSNEGCYKNNSKK